MARFNERKLAAEVVARLAKAGDPRFRKVMTSLVNHLHALLLAGNVAMVARLGKRIMAEAKRLNLDDLYVKASVLTGISHLKRGAHKEAQKYYDGVETNTGAPFSQLLFWRFGEALASLNNDPQEAAVRHAEWSKILRRLGGKTQEQALKLLQELRLPPQQRLVIQTPERHGMVGTEELGTVDFESVDLLVDIRNQQILHHGKVAEFKHAQSLKLLLLLAKAYPEGVTTEDLLAPLFGSASKAITKKLEKVLVEVRAYLTQIKGVKIQESKQVLKLQLSKSYVLLKPVATDLSEEQRKIMDVLSRLTQVTLQAIQAECGFSRPVARRNLDELVHAKIIQEARLGRSLTFRLN